MPVPTHRIAIDPARPLASEARTGHNRWHEAIPPALEVDPGDVVVLETRDAVDGHKSFTGELVGASDDEVTIAAGTGVVAIPYDDIDRSNLVEE